MEENTVTTFSLDVSINFKAKVKFCQEQRGNWAYKLFGLINTNEADAPLLFEGEAPWPYASPGGPGARGLWQEVWPGPGVQAPKELGCR